MSAAARGARTSFSVLGVVMLGLAAPPACAPDAKLGAGGQAGGGPEPPVCSSPPPPADGDGDGVPDAVDLCPSARDRAQVDSDGDGLGDACDPCLDDPSDDCTGSDLARYRLDEAPGAASVADAAPAAGAPGSVVGGVALGALGRLGSAAQFDGGGRITVAGVAGTSGELSVSAYLWLDAAGSGARVIATSGAFELAVDASGRLTCALFSGGVSESVTAPEPLATESWHHVACGRPIDPNAVARRFGLYLDGVVVAGASEAATFGALDAFGTVVLGARADGSQGLVGRLDEVRISSFGWLFAADIDKDGVPDVADNCPGTANFAQRDADGDLAGDACGRPQGSSCASAAECDDADPCSADFCTPCGCAYADAPGACDDGDAFTTDDRCEAGRCRGDARDYAPASDETLPAGHHFFRDVSIPAGVTVTCAGATGGRFYGEGCTLHARDVDIAGALDADGQGFGAGAGPGSGSDGGSHGGNGFGATFAVYGDDGAPTALGSGGLGAPGGGAIHIIASGTVRVSGSVSARGATGPSFHSGSGGSVWIRASELLGTGLLSAAGGAADAAGAHGGGGGRLKLEVLGSAFEGERSVEGGGSAEAGTLIE